MPNYVMLMRYHSDGFKAVKEDPRRLLDVHEALGRWEAKVLHSYHMQGDWDQMTIFEAPDNLPVDLVFTIIVPEEATEEHLMILSSLASIFSKADVCDAIRNAQSSDEVTRIIDSADQ